MAAVAYPPSQIHVMGPTDAASAEHLDISTDFFASTHAVEVSHEPPTKSELAKVANHTLLTEKGENVTFQSLWQSEDPSKRTLVIFVRHFFCGNCQEYLRTLSESITPDSLSSLARPTNIVVIGCGQPDLIPFYRETTGCPYPIYTDPTRELYVRLGMARTMAPGEKKPDYVRKSMFGIVTSGITQGFTAGKNAFKGGDFWQVGGEFLFEGGEVTQSHRMSTTRDHAEMSVMRVWLGLDEHEDDDTDDSSPSRNKRSILADIGANMRRSISRQRRSPSRSSGSRKASESSLNVPKGRKESMEKVNE